MRLDHARPVKGLLLRHQADHLARLCLHRHLGDARPAGETTIAVMRRCPALASISSKRSQKRRCASTAGSGVDRQHVLGDPARLAEEFLRLRRA